MISLDEGAAAMLFIGELQGAGAICGVRPNVLVLSQPIDPLNIFIFAVFLSFLSRSSSDGRLVALIKVEEVNRQQSSTSGSYHYICDGCGIRSSQQGVILPQTEQQLIKHVQQRKQIHRGCLGGFMDEHSNNPRSSSQNPSFVLTEPGHDSPGKVVIENRPVPTISNLNDVIVEIKNTGICGSGMLSFEG